MSKIIVLKFGGSSLENDDKLKLVAKRIAKIYDKNKKVVVVLSAQGKTTDTLLKSATRLSKQISARELSSLLSTGEQVSISKLSILLNYMGYPAISLTGWQAGIHTDSMYENSKIKYINTNRILSELNKNNIVLVAGFQGVNDTNDITTLGRGGSDTTAVAIAAAINSKKCYIFSDVDGIYTADPNKVENAKKLSNISYGEMLELSNEGAKVLHNRCVQIAEKFSIPLIAESTFSDETGTEISNNIETNNIKSIIKKENSRISIIGNGIIYNIDKIKEILTFIQNKKIEMLNIEISETKIVLTFKNIVEDNILEEIHQLIIN